MSPLPRTRSTRYLFARTVPTRTSATTSCSNPGPFPTGDMGLFARPGVVNFAVAFDASRVRHAEWAQGVVAPRAILSVTEARAVRSRAGLLAEPALGA